MEKKQIIKIIVSSAVIILVAGLGSLFVQLGMDWFNALIKPSQWVPNFVIPIVWTVVYLAFGVINFIWFKNDDIPTSTIY